MLAPSDADARTMTHEFFYLQRQSHETLTLILVGGGVSSAIVVAFALYLNWKGRHARKAARLAREGRKAEKRRRRRGQRHATPN